ncbi:hypothetical protein BDU57DRAFT_440093 [Ampelomyces quisqualis]|uniref:Uncharacterized protein n=1 Tax=Ampelomyces quisqualis TaxID=50730 RepID=A0A6A5R261_AMPQU|nr:hypothetical protein BDU57DRAFT_440093 [Ampelomyces quisqualis]
MGSFSYASSASSTSSLSWRRPSSSSSSSSSWRRSSTTPSTPSPPRSRQSSLSSEKSSNWRAGARPLEASSKSLPGFDDVELGMVFFLPYDEAPADSKIHATLEETENPWGHPAVVVAKWLDHGKACVRIRLCTSFGGKRIEKAKLPEHHHFFLLADNEEDTTPHEGTALARMAGSAKFGKRTYVNLSTKSEYPIEYKYLSPWASASQIQFDCKAVNKILSFKPHIS